MRKLNITEAVMVKMGKTADYSKIALLEKSASQPTVGIWWYVQGKVLKVEELPENLEHSDMVCVPQEHNRTFKFFQEQYGDEIEGLRDVRFNEIERGRVWLIQDIHHPGKQLFLITCSTSVSKDPVAIQAIKNSFGLGKQRVNVEAQPGLYDREIKLK